MVVTTVAIAMDQVELNSHFSLRMVEQNGIRTHIGELKRGTAHSLLRDHHVHRDLKLCSNTLLPSP